MSPGGPAIVYIDCTAREEIDPVIFGVEIGTAGIFPVASLPCGYSEPRTLKRGRNELVCYMECLPLMPGWHVLGAAFLKGNSPAPVGSMGYEDSPLSFEIKARPDAAMNVAFFRKNIMHIPCSWSMN